MGGGVARPPWLRRQRTLSAARWQCLSTLLLCLLTLALPRAEAQSAPPPPPAPFLTTFVNNNTYMFFKVGVFYPEAESICRSNNAHLTSITSKAEDDLIFNICTKNLSIVDQRLGGCWIGARDDKKDGDWYWTDGSPYNYNIWARFNNDPARNSSKQPNGGDAESCAALVYNYGIPGIGYKDWNCTANRFYVACKIGSAAASSGSPTPNAPGTPPAAAKRTSKKDGPPVALIAGAVGGAIALLAVIAASIFVCCKYQCCHLLLPPPPPLKDPKDIEDPLQPPRSSLDWPTPPASLKPPPSVDSALAGQPTATTMATHTSVAGNDSVGQHSTAAASTVSARTSAASAAKVPVSGRSSMAASQASARDTTRSYVYNRPPPGMPMVQGNPFAAAPAGAGAIAAAGLLPACLSLAGGILANADRVVANNARCMQLVGRITAMKPLLLDLQGKLQARGAEGEQELVRLEPMLLNIKSVLDDVSACIGSWTSEGSNRNALTVLRNLMAAAWYQDRFVELNVNLSAALMDLSLALQIPVHHANRAIDRQALEAEAAMDTAKDLEGLVQELVGSEEPGSGPDRLTALGSAEREKLQQIFLHHGLSLDVTVRNARMSKLDSKVQQLMIPSADIELQQQLGAGGFGTVHAGLWRVVTPVAVKKLQVGFLTERTKSDIKREAFIHSEADNHPNICQMYGLVLEEPDVCMLVMELCVRGSLHNLLHDLRRTLTWRQKIQIALDAASGMAHLHAKQIVHGDVKPSNFLVKDDGRVVVSDFGLSAVAALTLSSATRSVSRPSPQGGSAGGADGAAGGSRSGTGMSLWYTPPEALANPTAAKTPEGDVYAFGMVLLEVATRAVPFGTGDFDVVMYMVLSGKRPQVPEDVPGAFRQLIEQCWSQEPADRPKFAAMASTLHAMLASVN